MEKIGIIGAGGQARETEQYLKDSGIDPVFFAVNAEYISDKNQIDILSPDEYEKLTPVIAAIGAPETRRKMVESWQGNEFSSVIAKDAYVGDNVEVGKGSIIAPRAVLTAGIEVGEHVIVNVGSTIAHDVKLGDFTTVSPGVHIAGNVEIGRGVFIGIGAIISNDVKIADGVVVGAGTVVLSDIVEPNSVVVGIPAKVIKINEGWISEI